MVDSAVQKYESALTEVNARLADLVQKNADLEERLKQTRAELSRMQMEMSLVQLPDVSDIQEAHVLEKFTRSTYGKEEEQDFNASVVPKVESAPEPRQKDISDAMAGLDIATESESQSSSSTPRPKPTMPGSFSIAE